MKLLSRNRSLDIGDRVGIVAILNITPDSYVDGGKYTQPEALMMQALRCIDEGADILEIGGESTGPKSKDVSPEEEIARVIPAVRAVRDRLPDAWIAVDTWKADVARKALDVGADMINDITAGRGDPAMLSLIAAAGCPYVMMYGKDSTARTTINSKQYSDVCGVIHDFLRMRILAAVEAGVRPGQMIIDPGLGHFVSADPEYSFAILRSLGTFSDLGPILVSPSRKSFLAGSRNLPPSERLPATLAATVIAAMNGANFIRTHDVKETGEVLNVVTLSQPRVT
ncbi:MAG: dihydropteroate synthase [Candidatus Peribacteraceae bacterium]|nr:dihydropteroate synthase [Candidatus Peribacteraceae bacterium]